MTRIRASCPSCGEVDLRPADLTLTIVRDADGQVADGSAYRFRCPACTHVVAKPADARIADLLRTGGVQAEERQQDHDPVDRRPPHPEAPPGGPRLTHDDLLDLHLLLTTNDWFEQLLTTSR